MKKTIISVVVMLLASSLFIGTVLIAILPKGKYSDSINLNVDNNVLQKYTSMDILSKDFEERNISIDEKINEWYRYDFKENRNKQLKHMNGTLTIRFINSKDGNQKVYKADIKNFFPFKTLSLIEIYGEDIVISYKYDFICCFLLFEAPTAIIFTLVILKKNYFKRKEE